MASAAGGAHFFLDTALVATPLFWWYIRQGGGPLKANGMPFAEKKAFSTAALSPEDDKTQGGISV